MKNQNGITLIAVIITVILMIILATVSINFAKGNNGVLNNSQKAAKDLKISESKEYILETWGYVLSKVDNNEVPYYNNSNARNTQILADGIFRRYIVEYGNGIMVEKESGDFVYNIRVKGKNFEAFKIKFTLKGEPEPYYFYIVNDTEVYSSEEANEV